MPGDTVHAVKDFGQCPFDSLVPSNMGYRQWSLGRGGFGLKDSQWVILVDKEGDGQDVWPVPPSLNHVFDHLVEQGRREVKNSFKALLGVT